MSRESVFPIVIRPAVRLIKLSCVALLVSSATVSQAAQPDRHTRAYLGDLDAGALADLKRSLQASLVTTSGSGRKVGVPAYQLYQSVFLTILMTPALAAGLSDEDRELIQALPTHDSPAFTVKIQQAMRTACKVIDRLAPSSPAAAPLAVQAFRRAQRQAGNHLNRHYGQVLRRLSAPGRALVDAQADALTEAGRLIHSEMDLTELSFSQPGYVTSFLRDSCENARQLPRPDVSPERTLEDMLSDDFDRGAVQIFENN